MTRDTRLSINAGTSLEDPTTYYKLVGQLIYLLNPYLSYPVQQLSQHMSNPTNLHHQAVIRVLRYLKNSPAQGLFFPSISTLHLKAFSDLDWATCPDKRKFMTSYCIYLGESIILWKLKKQLTVSRNSTEAEYHVMVSIFL